MSIGRSWPAAGGHAEVIGTYKDGRFLVKYPGSPFPQIHAGSELDALERYDARGAAADIARHAHAVAAAAAADARLEHRQFHGFTTGMSALQVGKLTKVLDKQINTSEWGLVSRYELVEKAIAAGYCIEAEPGKVRKLVSPRDTYFNEPTLTKTVMDYAAFRAPMCPPRR